MNCKNVLSAYSIASQDVNSGASIPLVTNKLLTGDSICHTLGSTQIKITSPGLYYISFVCDADISTTGNLVISLQNGSTAIADTTQTNAATAGTNSKVIINTVIRVRPSCCAIDNTLDLSFVNLSSVAIAVENVSVSVFQL